MTHMLNFVKRHPPELENKIVRNVVKHWETRLKRRGVPSICLDWLYTFTRFVFWILWGLDTLCHAGQEWSTFTLWTRQNEKGKGACCVFGGLLCIARLLYQVEGRFKGAAVCRGFSRLCCTLRQVPISQVQGTELTLACDKHGLHLILLDTWACPSTSTQAISVCGFVGSLHFRSYSGNLAFAHTSAFADLRHWTILHARNLILILKSEDVWSHEDWCSYCYKYGDLRLFGSMALGQSHTEHKFLQSSKMPWVGNQKLDSVPVQLWPCAGTTIHFEVLVFSFAVIFDTQPLGRAECERD